MLQKRLSYATYRSIFKKVPRLCVDLVIRDRRGVVLSRRDIPPYRGKWHLPGGRVYHRERLSEAVKRVASAETGLRVSALRNIGAIEYLHEGSRGHSVSVVFLVRPAGGTLRGSEQAARIAFFRTVPQGTIAEVASFLVGNKILRAPR